MKRTLLYYTGWTSHPGNTPEIVQGLPMPTLPCQMPALLHPMPALSHPMPILPHLMPTLPHMMPALSVVPCTPVVTPAPTPEIEG